MYHYSIIGIHNVFLKRFSVIGNLDVRRSKKILCLRKTAWAKWKLPGRPENRFFLTIIQASFKFSTATCYLPPATDVSATTKVFCIFSQYVPSVTGGWIEERYTIIRFTRQDLITKTCIQVGRRKKWKSAPFLRPGKGVKKVHPGGFSQTNQYFFSPYGTG